MPHELAIVAHGRIREDDSDGRDDPLSPATPMSAPCAKLAAHS